MNKQTAADSASRETSVGPLLISVTLPASRGVQSVGEYQPKKPYILPADEAIRLVSVKGFEYTSPADAQLAATHIEQRNATVIAEAEVAAAAAGDGGGPISKNQE